MTGSDESNAAAWSPIWLTGPGEELASKASPSDPDEDRVAPEARAEIHMHGERGVFSGPQERTWTDIAPSEQRDEARHSEAGDASFPVGGSDIHKLSWVDIGMAAAPGRYASRYGIIEVTADDLWVWAQYPNTAFALIEPSPFAEEAVCRLGTFNLRQNWNVPRDEK